MMDTNPRPRIFISSLMAGYSAVRDAASRAIGRSGCEPVRAEDVPAGTVSPRTACLNGVASSDGLVLILGARYGEPTVAGISATEEEDREAVPGERPRSSNVRSWRGRIPGIAALEAMIPRAERRRLRRPRP